MCVYPPPHLPWQRCVWVWAHVSVWGCKHSPVLLGHAVCADSSQSLIKHPAKESAAEQLFWMTQRRDVEGGGRRDRGGECREDRIGRGWDGGERDEGEIEGNGAREETENVAESGRDKLKWDKWQRKGKKRRMKEDEGVWNRLKPREISMPVS